MQIKFNTHFTSFITLLIVLSVYCTQSVASSSLGMGYTPKYKPGFDHFDYVNPTAEKKGKLVLSAFGNFDSLNPYLLKGIAASGITDLILEPLMVQSQDEPFSVYAHIANDIELAKDKLSVTFKLNPDARFSDGSAVTAEDVKFTFDTLKSDKAHPRFGFFWADIKKAVVVNKLTVRFEFVKVNPELHMIAAQMPVFAKKWIGDKPFNKVSDTPPIGTGPYVLDKYDLGKNISFVRNPNYWAKDKNTRKGMFNFEKITFKYYKDFTIMLEAFKAGEFDWMWEFNSKKWARDYKGPKFTSGEIVVEEIDHNNNAGMQGFIFNTRKEIFKDQRVRRAITLAFDFKWSNEKLFYNQYERCYSYFSNSDLAAARTLPVGDELALLNEFKDKLPPEVFTKVWKPPSTEKPSSLRKNLRKATKLLKEAGWKIKGGVLKNNKDEAFAFEMILSQKGFERILAPFARNLKKLGIALTYRTVDVSLYQSRSDTFDYEMIVASFPQSQSPGNELLNYWHSSTADKNGSNNAIGIKDPVVDALIEKAIYAKDRKQLVTAVHALDRVLLHGDYQVPNWFIGKHRIAYKKIFSYPKNLPKYFSADSWMMSTWWRL